MYFDVMQEIVHQVSGKTYSCRLLTDDDLEALNVYKRRILEEAMQRSRVPAQQINKIIDGIVSVDAPVQAREKLIFGLFDEGQMIGETNIVFAPRCKFTGSHVLRSYAGNRLSNLLYEVRISYLIEHTQINMVEAQIERDNQPSRKAAIRNGLKIKGLGGAFFAHSSNADTYVLDLRPLRECLDEDNHSKPDIDLEIF
jgi:hypothetical protein